MSNTLRWAERKRLIKVNPISTRIRYHSPTNARHCKELAPVSADELHEFIQPWFANPRSESLAWQAVFEAATGLRTQEALALRMDAKPNEPGWLAGDGRSLCVRRCKKASRENPFVEVHVGLDTVLSAHRVWHQHRHPKSVWFFPGKVETEPLSEGALTRAIAQLFQAGKIPRKITSHGLRAFYVLVRRSHGISDTQIAWEINHIGGVTTIEQCYGGVPQHWREGRGPKLSWLPSKVKPAWELMAVQSETGDGP